MRLSHIYVLPKGGPPRTHINRSPGSPTSPGGRVRKGRKEFPGAVGTARQVEAEFGRRGAAIAVVVAVRTHWDERRPGIAAYPGSRVPGKGGEEELDVPPPKQLLLESREEGEVGNEEVRLSDALPIPSRDGEDAVVEGGARDVGDVRRDSDDVRVTGEGAGEGDGVRRRRRRARRRRRHQWRRRSSGGGDGAPVVGDGGGDGREGRNARGKGIEPGAGGPGEAEEGGGGTMRVVAALQHHPLSPEQ